MIIDNSFNSFSSWGTTKVNYFTKKDLQGQPRYKYACNEFDQRSVINKAYMRAHPPT